MVAFLVDESLPCAVTRALVAAGHDVVDVRDVGLRGASDDAIAARHERPRRSSCPATWISRTRCGSRRVRIRASSWLVCRTQSLRPMWPLGSLWQSPPWALFSRARSRSSKRRAFASSVVVTPLGLERVLVAPSVREDPLVSDGDPGFEQDDRGHERTRAVASLATALADAVLAGDQERATALAQELRALQER